MGVGNASGKDKAEAAARAAISSPLLETSIKGATGILISITASPDVGLEDVDVASQMIANETSEDASVIWGVAFDNELEDEMRITIIATGFDKSEASAPVKRPTVAAAPKAKPAPAQKPAYKDDLSDILGGFGSYKK